MNRIWGVLPLISAPMPFQMALDERLFRRHLAGDPEHPVLRFFFSSEPWVTVGFSDPEPLLPGVKTCRRMTGGGRVQHGSDLIFSLVARREDDESFRSVRASYGHLHEAVALAYRALGRKTRFYREDENLPRGGECFLHPIASDLSWNGAKVAGGAQKRSMGVMLHQESLKLPGIEALEFCAALKRAFQQVFKTALQNMPLDPEWVEEAHTLAREKYDPAACAGQETPVLEMVSGARA